MLYSNYMRYKSRNTIKFKQSEGNPCVLARSKGKNLKNYEVYGNSFQATRSGKNLIPYPYIYTTTTINGVTFTDNGDGSITVNGTATDNAVFYLVGKQDNYTLDKCGLKIGDSYTISKTLISGDGMANIYFTANYYNENGSMKAGASIYNTNTATATIQSDFVMWGIYLLVLKDKTVNNTTIKLQLEKGSSATEYEQYGVMPSPEFPSEIQSVGDLTTKNLLPYPYINSTMTYYGITFTDNNGIITLDGTTTLSETEVADFKLMSNAKLEAGTYTLSGCPKTGATYTYRLFVNISHDDNTNTYVNEIGNGSTFTVTNTDLVTITIRIGGQLGTVSNLVFKPQLEKGSTATEYEPYHKYDIPITVAGKNLIPYPYMYTTKTENGVTWTDNGDGSVTVSGTATGYSDFFFKTISIAPNTTFTFSKNQSDDAANIAFLLKQLDENKALIGTEISLIPTVVTHTFTTAENARYIQIACKRYGNVECKGTYKPMLELGDTATEYEPYHEPITTHIYLDEPLRKVGGYSDYVDFKKQKVVRNIKEITLNGSENWSLQGTNENGIISFICSISNETAPSTTNISALSTHYSYKITSLSNTTEQGFFVQRGGITNLYIRMFNEEIVDIAAFKTWLSKNKVKVYYQMATPTEEPLSLPTLQTFKGTTIMSVDTSIQPSNVKAKYIRT